MPNIIKPFTITSTKPEMDGGTGVNFEITKVQYLDDNRSKTKTVKMVSYISVPEGEDIDTYLYSYLQKGGWV